MFSIFKEHNLNSVPASASTLTPPTSSESAQASTFPLTKNTTGDDDEIIVSLVKAPSPESKSLTQAANSATSSKKGSKSAKSLVKKPKSTFPFGKCKVCDDKATGVHYGISTCEGCKVSF